MVRARGTAGPFEAPISSKKQMMVSECGEIKQQCSDYHGPPTPLRDCTKVAFSLLSIDRDTLI